VGQTEFVLSQLYARFARIFDEDGVEFFSRGDVSWSETNVVQATNSPATHAPLPARRKRAGRTVRDRTVAELVDAAPAETHVHSVAAVRAAGEDGCRRSRHGLDHARSEVCRSTIARVSSIDGSGPPASTRAGLRRAAMRAASRQALVQGLAAAEDVAAEIRV
jgi:hypothetical protein